MPGTFDVPSKGLHQKSLDEIMEHIKATPADQAAGVALNENRQAADALKMIREIASPYLLEVKDPSARA